MKKFPKTKRLGSPEKVLNADWFEYDPYAGAVSGRKLFIKDGAVRHDVCLARILKVGDTIPSGMVLHELI